MTTRDEATLINNGLVNTYDSTSGTEFGGIARENKTGGFEITPGQVNIPQTPNVSLS